MREKVLLDTDIGTDIDDAICLAYLLAQPACELMGITTVTGQAVERARMASALCRVAGTSIPIYPGAELPLLVPQQQQEAGQAAALTGWDHDRDFPRDQAIPFLRDTIRAHPGEITLLAIGPLTNIGLLFASAPDVPPLLKQLVLMCGSFTPDSQAARPREWNAIGDPHATAIVYRAAPPLHISYGLDVTTKVTMPAAEVRTRFQAPLLRPVLDFAEVWFRHRDIITFHDPLAAAGIFNPAICRLDQGRVSVELADRERLGATDWSAGDGPHHIATDVDPDAFFGEFFGILG